MFRPFKDSYSYYQYFFYQLINVKKSEISLSQNVPANDGKSCIGRFDFWFLCNTFVNEIIFDIKKYGGKSTIKNSQITSFMKKYLGKLDHEGSPKSEQISKFRERWQIYLWYPPKKSSHGQS